MGHTQQNKSLPATTENAVDCAGAQRCPVTGQRITGWVSMASNEKLRKRIIQWVQEQGINYDLLDNAAVMMHQLYAAAG